MTFAAPGFLRQESNVFEPILITIAIEKLGNFSSQFEVE
jgi:hypothetical protein